MIYQLEKGLNIITFQQAQSLKSLKLQIVKISLFDLSTTTYRTVSKNI